MTTTSRPACQDLEPAEADRLFFDRRHALTARRLCVSCPVAGACLAAALEAERQEPTAYRFGVFAGTLPEERAKADRTTVRGRP